VPIHAIHNARIVITPPSARHHRRNYFPMPLPALNTGRFALPG